MNLVLCAGILATLGLAAGLTLEHQACLKLDAQNDALRRQLASMANLAVENQRLSDLLAQATASRLDTNGASGTNLATDGRMTELARLRRQMETFQRQSNEVASLRADTSATRATLEETRLAYRARQTAGRSHPADASGAALEILAASYGTDRTNLDVTAGLSDRIRGSKLKMIASNRLAGDPDFGHVKDLTVVYRFGGVVQTNQFREGDIVVLPPETP